MNDPEENVVQTESSQLSLEEGIKIDGENDEGDQESSDENRPEPSHESFPSHFRNAEAHPAYLRYGIPLYFLATFGLLLASDLGSGVQAVYITRTQTGVIVSKETLFTASIFSSIKELWNTGSKALAIFIVITSVLWPYVKIALSVWAWVAPFGKRIRRREILIEVIDLCGKWSFVDIFVLAIIMVAFRTTIQAGSGTLDVVVEPLWGLYGFVLATMLSLAGTELVLHHHRKVAYPDPSDKANPTAHLGESDGVESNAKEEHFSLARTVNLSKWLVGLALVVSVALHIAGCMVDVFEVTSRRELLEFEESLPYGVLTIGSRLPASALEPNDVGIRWLQAMYYFLAFCLPLCNSVEFGVLYLYPLSRIRQTQMFALAEATFAWNSLEVVVISIIFAVLQIPKFGNGLIDSGCDQCYEVDSSFLSEFAVLAVSMVVNIATNVYLYRKCHTFLHGSSSADG